MKFPEPKKIYDYQDLARWVEAEGYTRVALRKLHLGPDGCGQNTVHVLCREHVRECDDPKDKELAEMIFEQAGDDGIEIEVWW